MSTSLSKDIPTKTIDGVGIESPVHVNLAINNPKKRSGRKKFHETRHPVLRGIRCRNNDKKWVCELRLPDNKKGRIWLGSYDTTEMAARAHDVGAIALLGPKACLNFEDSLWLLPIPTSMDPIDIKKAARLAAEAFRPKTMEMDPTQVEEEDEDEEEEDALPPTADFEWLDEEEDMADFEWLDDEERMLMDDMADGLMIPRPHYTSTSDDSQLVDDVPLWSFSV